MRCYDCFTQQGAGTEPLRKVFLSDYYGIGFRKVRVARRHRGKWAGKNWREFATEPARTRPVMAPEVDRRGVTK